MWIFFYYNHWQYEKAEQFLCDMESNGYRLETVKFTFFFKFRKSAPKKVKYVFLYNFVKDYRPENYDFARYIYTVGRGSRICGKKHFESNVYRITNLNAELKTFFVFRDIYLKRVFLLKMCMSMFFFLPSVLLYVLGLYEFFDAHFIILQIVTVISLLFFGYNFVGLLSTLKR